MKDTFYFSHDYNAASDEKIIKLLSRHGMAGYGIFWRLVENLYNNANVMTIDFDRIAYDLRFPDTKIIESIIKDFNLFQIEGNCFGSVSIEKRLAERNEKSQKARQSVNVRWGKIKKNTDVQENNTNVFDNDTSVPKIDTIKESIEKDSIDSIECKEESLYASEIINYLNQKTGKLFKANTKQTLKAIEARKNEGRILVDFYKVIDNKVADWKDDPKMDKYLCPETLFGPKFEKYLNERIIQGKKKGNGPGSIEIEEMDHTQSLYENGNNN
jgi:uncharacterized phage protein (TIGR02220 family)